MTGKLLFMNGSGHSEIDLEDRPDVQTRLGREVTNLSGGRKQFTHLSPQEAVEEVNRMLNDGWIVAYRMDPGSTNGEQIERIRGIQLEEETLVHRQFVGG